MKGVKLKVYEWNLYFSRLGSISGKIWINSIVAAFADFSRRLPLNVSVAAIPEAS